METLLKTAPKAFFCRQAGMVIDCVVWEPKLRTKESRDSNPDQGF